MSPEEVRQLLRRAGPHEREALVRRLDKDARQTFKVRVTRRSRNRRVSQNDAGTRVYGGTRVSAARAYIEPLTRLVTRLMKNVDREHDNPRCDSEKCIDDNSCVVFSVNPVRTDKKTNETGWQAQPRRPRGI